MKESLIPVYWNIGGVSVVLFLVFSVILITRRNLRRVEEEFSQRTKLIVEHQQQLMASTIATQEKERERIASEIHDDLIGQLHRIKLMNEHLTLKPMLAESIRTARVLSHELYPPLLQSTRFVELINRQVHPLLKRYAVEKHIDIRTEKDLSVEMKLNALRIFQEVLTNCVKHSEAKTIEISYKSTDRYDLLQVIDDGKGTINVSEKGMGLKNIESRTQLLKGISKFGRMNKIGTSFTLLIPRT